MFIFERKGFYLPHLVDNSGLLEILISNKQFIFERKGFYLPHLVDNSGLLKILISNKQVLWMYRQLSEQTIFKNKFCKLHSANLFCKLHSATHLKTPSFLSSKLHSGLDV